jgi:hypothetical protein
MPEQNYYTRMPEQNFYTKMPERKFLHEDARTKFDSENASDERGQNKFAIHPSMNEINFSLSI